MLTLHLLKTSGLNCEPKYFKTKLREAFVFKGRSYTYSSGELVQLIRLWSLWLMQQQPLAASWTFCGWQFRECISSLLSTANTHSCLCLSKSLGLVSCCWSLATWPPFQGKSWGESCGSVWVSIRFDPLQERTLVLMGIQGKQLAAWLVLSDELSVIPYLNRTSGAVRWRRPILWSFPWPTCRAGRRVQPACVQPCRQTASTKLLPQVSCEWFQNACLIVWAFLTPAVVCGYRDCKPNKTLTH